MGLKDINWKRDRETFYCVQLLSIIVPYHCANYCVQRWYGQVCRAWNEENKTNYKLYWLIKQRLMEKKPKIIRDKSKEKKINDIWIRDFSY